MGAAPAGRDQRRRKFHSGLTDALLQFAEARFALSIPDEKTGKTRLQTLLEILKQTGVKAPELASLPRLPVEVAHIWDWFGDLNSARGAGMALEAISWSDMRAYFEMVSVKPTRWEINALRRLDGAWLESRSGRKKKAAKGARALGSAITGKRTQIA